MSKKGTFGLGCKLTLTKNTDNFVLNKEDNAINNAKSKIIAVEWYVPHYTPSISIQALLSKQISSRVPTEFQYVERSVFMKEVNTQTFWTFELGTQEGNNIPFWIIVGFQQRVRQDSQNLSNGTFYSSPVTSAECIIGTENNPGSAILLSHHDDENSQGYGQIKRSL